MLELSLLVLDLFLFAFIVGVPASIILRAAIRVENKMTGGGDSATPFPEPSIGKAIRISFFALLYISVARYLGQLVIFPAMDWLQITGGYRTLIGILKFLLISVLVMAGMLRFYLPITLMSAARVALSWTLMILALLALLKVIIHYALG